MLPDVALLEIFDIYMLGPRLVFEWYHFVHVCRKWRNVIFGSPRRLGLRLYSTAWTPVRETLDAWPPLPIVAWEEGHREWGLDNIIAALEHNDRICEIDFREILQFESVLEAMQKPFPELTNLVLWAGYPNLIYHHAQVLPDSLLGGFAPRLQSLSLINVSFRGLPKLLLSSTHLVQLHLSEIPDSGYISPEALTTCLSVLTRLESLDVGLRYCPNRNRRRPAPQTRIFVPGLTNLSFRGVSEYLEDLVSRIDAPILSKLSVSFFLQLIFDIPQLAQFICRTPRLKTHDEARVEFNNWRASVTLPQTLDGNLNLGFSHSQGKSDWELSSLAQVCNSLSFHQNLIPAVERLYIQCKFILEDWEDDVESGQWRELLRTFISVEDLYISSSSMPRIAPALQELVEEGVTGVLPALQTLFLEEMPLSGPFQEAIGKFVSARQLAGHPIAVSRWERKDGNHGND
jgi:hypothetical protein